MTDPIHVLVVDDSVTIRAMMTQVLQRDPIIRVVAVGSVAEAERVLADGLFDVITLDIQMPGVNGLDYLKRLRTRHDIPVVMLSASTGRGAESRTEALLAGATGCFDKADSMRNAPELIRLVKDAARRKAKIGREDIEAMSAARG